MRMIPWTGETRGLTTLQDRLNRMFDDFFVGGAPETAASWAPSVDVSETDDAVVVRAEVPGIDPGDLDIEVQGDQLMIRGEKKEEHEEKERTFRHVERRYGAFVRRIPLPASIDADKVDASAERGVVKITLPKQGGSRARRIEVRSG